MIKLQQKFDLKYKHCHSKLLIDKVFCKMVDILFRAQCVNLSRSKIDFIIGCAIVELFDQDLR